MKNKKMVRQFAILAYLCYFISACREGTAGPGGNNAANARIVSCGATPRVSGRMSFACNYRSKPGSIPDSGMVAILEGSFMMGSRDFEDAKPLHKVSFSSFFMDAHEVSNEALAKFIAATAYIAIAERALDPAEFPGVEKAKLQPGSAVFHANGSQGFTQRPDAMVALYPGGRLEASIRPWQFNSGKGKRLGGAGLLR